MHSTLKQFFSETLSNQSALKLITLILHPKYNIFWELQICLWYTASPHTSSAATSVSKSSAAAAVHLYISQPDMPPTPYYTHTALLWLTAAAAGIQNPPYPSEHPKQSKPQALTATVRVAPTGDWRVIV